MSLIPTGPMLRPLLSLYLAFLSISLLSVAYAQQARVLSGTVIDSVTGQPLAGASIYVRDTKRGTFTRSSGQFRLPLEAAHKVVTVRSIGYAERTLNIPDNSDSIRIALSRSDVTAATITVTAGMTPEELIRLAIVQKEANAARINTLISTLYSKMRVDLGGSLLEGKDIPPNSITETFSKVYERRRPNPHKEVVILQRRQTKNILPAENLAVFDEFFDFTEDDITIIKTQLITPLGRDALDEYKYTITGKKMLNDKLIYELSFEPKSRIFPGFEGTLSIVEGTYQLIATAFAPTQETAIPFFRGLRFEQQYERYDDSIWVPAFQLATASAHVAFIKGLAEIEARFAIQTYATDVQVNVPLPDSIGKTPTKSTTTGSVDMSDNSVSLSIGMEGKRITVAPDADSVRTEFWEAHAFAEPSEEEREIYRRADSIGPRRDSTGKPIDSAPTVGLIHLPSFGGVGFGLSPVLDRSTITGVMYGGELVAATSYANLKIMGSLGAENTRAGSVGLNVKIVRNADLQLDATAKIFSIITTLQGSRSVLRRFETFDVTDLFFADNLDYFRRDGFDVGARLAVGRFNITAIFADARHINMPVITGINRTPVTAHAGAYRTVHASVAAGQPTLIDNLLGTAWPVFGTISMLYGQETITARTFSNVEVHLGTVVPTFATGYKPMELSVDVKGGFAVDSMPRQYQFASLRRFVLMGPTTDLATVPINAYAGTEYVSVHAEHNFSDMWWRAIGLPTYNGRGIDLIGKFSALNMVQRGQAVESGRVFDSTHGWYTEAGFAVSRVPTFISDFLFLRFDVLWPVGAVATPRGTFGWSITVSSPIL